jgi:hypothetical protein
VKPIRSRPGEAGGLEGFVKWSDIAEDYMEWTPEEYKRHLRHPKAMAQFKNDIEAMRSCDACLGE